MVGFLLNDDAVEARKNVFDSWIDEQKRNAERATQQVQQAAQQTAQQHTQEVAARAQQFQDWIGQQPAQPTVTAPPVAEVAPQPAAPAAPNETVSSTSPESGDVAARARAFQDWITEQTQKAVQPAPMPSVPADVLERGAQAAPMPSLPPNEEPATRSDAVGPELGGKWKTSFDHGATYTGNYRTGTPHRGIDLVPHQGGIGTSVEAFAPGTVTNISRDSGAGGNMVYVQDEQGLTHAYMHLQSAAPGLKVGQRINRGDVIATMGESGTEGSPHLHYEVRKNAATGDPLNALIDPRPYIGGQQQQAGTTPPSRFQPTGKPMTDAPPVVQEIGQGKQAFEQTIGPLAQWFSEQTGIDPAVYLAIAANETGWGASRTAQQQNNLFSIQGSGEGGRWAGYDSPQQAFEAFNKLISSAPRYAQAWAERHNPIEFINNLRKAGYVVDEPGYPAQGWVDQVSRIYGDISGRAGDVFTPRTGGAMEGALEAGRQVAGRAGELVSQGQQLAESGARGAEDAWRQLESTQARARADTDRWLAEQRARGEEWDAQRQRRDLDWQRSLDEQARGFGERAQGFMAPLTQGAETARDYLSGDLAARNRELGLAPEFQSAAAGFTRPSAGEMFPRNPLEAAGALVRGAPGTAMGGTLTLPEWQELEQRRRRDVSGFVRENVPGGNEPVIGGAMQMAAEELTSPTNLLLTGPLMGVGRGVAALVGGGTRGAIADWAVQGAIFSAITEASKPEATPESVGEAFLAGGVFGGGLRGAGALADRAATAGRRLLNSPEFQQVLRSRARGEAEAGFAAGMPTGGRGALEPTPTLEPPSRRMFHGTGAEFETPDAGRFDPNGLYGPAYYLTDEPRVAGGVVQRETEPLTAVQQSLIDRGLLSPENARNRAGAVLEPGYAQNVEGTSYTIQQEIQRLRNELADPSLSDRRHYAAEQGMLRLEGELDRALAGPNVRAVDVPAGVRLFDADAPLDVGVLDRITSLLDPQDARTLQSNLPYKTGRPEKWTNDVLYRRLSEIVDPPYANQLLRELGFDGVTHSGGQRVPIRNAAGEPLEHTVNVIFPESLPKIRNAISGRQGGFAQAPFAARLGGAAVGGYGGWETAPEEERKPAFNVGPVEVPSGMRVGRAIVGTGAGLAAPGIAQAVLSRSQLRQDMLERLRSAGIATAAPQPSRPVGLTTGTAVDVTKQLILTNPAGRILDLVGNTFELLRQPVALAMGGQGPEAAAGTAAIMRGLPEAFQNAAEAIRGRQVATLGQGAQDIGKSKPIFRILAAGDVFTRTLGEYQGMASRAVNMLNKAGIQPGTPQAEQYLALHVNELHREAVRSGTGSVFGSAQRGANASPLDKLMSKLSDAKEGLLNSPRKRDQALGALLDLNIPFSGTPSRVLQIGLQRIPGITQAAGAARIAAALQKGDTFAAQKALGEVTVETLIQLRIAQGIRDGDITGPDDPEHPSSMQVNGEWYPLRTLGVYGMPAGIMAAFAESWEKTGREPDPEVQERFAAALNASMEPLLDAVPGFSMMNTLAAMGRGGFTGAVEKQAQDGINRLLSPALVAQANNRLDPTMRDVHKRGWESLWEPLQAKTPFLSRYLPPKLDPTTGEPMTRGVTALGGAVKMSSPVREELARLKREGYDLNPPTDKPSSITIRGVPVPVRDGSPEQRAMVEARGQFLAETGDQMTKPSYTKMTDDQKAKFWSRMIDRSARKQEAAWRANVDPERAGRILGRGKRVVGRLQDVEDETEQINRQVMLASQLRRQQQRSA